MLMKPDQQTSIPALIEWREASKLSWLRWPAMVGVAGTLVTALNIAISGNNNLTIGSISFQLSDALCIFGCILLTTFPVWYYVTKRIQRGELQLSLTRQLAACLGFLIFALLAFPTFKVEHREYNSRNDITTTWIKRSLPETLEKAWFRHDELTWLQSNFSAKYIPANVACPRYSTRLFPLFGVIRDDALASALASDVGMLTDARPSDEALAAGIARCRVEGPAMRAAGETKESALMQGDIDRFFALDQLDHSPNDSIVLEDAEIPAPIMSKINAFLAAQPSAFGYLEDSDYEKTPGQVRRLKPILLAAALGRDKDVAFLKAATK
jgi:hypothetical protein